MAGAVIPMPEGQEPRGWQLEAWAAIRAGLARWDSILVQAATGTGKGTLIAGWCAWLAQRGLRVLFVVHRDELLQDVAGRLGRLGIEPGIVGGGARELDRVATLASVASLKPKVIAALLEAGPICYVVTDEAHHATASTYRRVYAALRAAGPVQHVGLTATPFRAGPEGATSGLGGVFEALVYEYPLQRAIADGVLVPVEGVSIRTSTTLEPAALDDDAAMDAALNTAPRNQLILDRYQEHGGGRPALGFATTIAHAQELARLFADAGLRAAAVWGVDPDRAAKLAAYRAGELDVLWCRDLLTEGVDLPRAEVLLMGRPTGSPVLYAQMIGRGTRTAPGKARCLVLDFVDVLEQGAVQTLPNLLATPEEKGDRQLKPGARVCHRHDPARADGNLVDTRDGVIVMARVAWVGWGELDSVPLADLRRYRQQEDGAEIDEVAVVAPLGAVAEYRIALIGGSALPWYRYSGSRGDVRYTLALDVGRGSRGKVAQLVREGPGIWSAWREGDTMPAHSGPLADCADAIAGWIAQVGLRPVDWTASWCALPITDQQAAALSRWGLRRPVRSLCRGEASILLTTKGAKARIDAARKVLAKRRAA